MVQAIVDNEFIATVAGDITVFNYDGETREFLHSSVEYLAAGVGIPANSCTDEPLALKTGFAVCRTADFAGWEYLADHRGETVYDTATGQPVEINVPGEYAGSVTTIVPLTAYDVWDGSEWVTDTEAQHTADVAAAELQQQALIAQADKITSDWRVELMLGDIRENDKQKLSAWMTYKSAVKAVDISAAPDVSWPVLPEV